MSKLLPQDIEDFLYELGTFDERVPGAFQEYVKTVAALLWEKYVILQDRSIEIMPSTANRCSATSKPCEN
jgi:hypothetical protein